MKKLFKRMLVVLLAVPCAAIFAACGPVGPSEPPNYEAEAGDHVYGSSEGFYTKTETNGYYEYTSDTLDEILELYYEEEFVYAPFYETLDFDAAERLDNKLDGSTGETVRAAISFFTSPSGKNFVITKDETDAYSGTISFQKDTYAETVPYDGCKDLAFTIDSDTGAMTITGGADYLDKSYVTFAYEDGELTVTVDAAKIIAATTVSDVSSSLLLDATQRGDIPPLWVQFSFR